ncbi:hypothetical protein J2X83_004584 [Brevibacillus nitrificans]|nr:hypothetical protein [Brevibacillus nitrificans]
MKKRAILFLCCICMLVLSGCWDDIQLRDTTFVYGVGVDRAEKSNLTGTYVVQKVRNANQGGGEKISDVISENNLQDVMTLMLDDGRDFGLPMFKIEGDRMSLMSLALFHGERFGGFFGVNSAHPFENPTPLSNVLEILSMFLIPVSLPFTFGFMAKNRKQDRLYPNA